MKGLELPINMIVVVAIAVLVLVVVAAFFAGQLGGGVDTIALENAFSSGCNNLRAIYNCDPAVITSGTLKVLNYAPAGHQISEYTASGGYPFSGICTAKNYAPGVVCAKACGCALP